MIKGSSNGGQRGSAFSFLVKVEGPLGAFRPFLSWVGDRHPEASWLTYLSRCPFNLGDASVRTSALRFGTPFLAFFRAFLNCLSILRPAFSDSRKASHAMSLVSRRSTSR